MDYYSIAKNHQVKALSKFNECYSLIMVIVFSLIPVMALFAPQEFGSIFSNTGKFLVYSLLFLGIFQLISYATFESSKHSLKDRMKFCMVKLGKIVSGHKVGIIFIVFLLLVMISALVAYFDGSQVIANLSYSGQTSEIVAKQAFDGMSFTDTRLYKGTEFRPDGVQMYFIFATLFIYVSMIKNKRFKQIVFVVNIVSFVFISFVVLQQYYGIIGSAGVKEPGTIGRKLMAFYDKKGVRIGHFFKGLTGGFYNSNHVAYYLLTGSMLISGMVIMAKKWYFKLLWSLLAIYSYYILIINDTFGCYIACVVALATVGALKLIADIKLLEKGAYKLWHVCLNSILPLILFVTISASFVAFSGENNSITKNFKTLKKDVKTVATSDKLEEEHAGSGRLEMWLATIKMVKEKPIFGYGPDNLKAEYLEKGVKLDRAHNEPLERAVASGVPAATVFYVGIFLAIYMFVKNKKNFFEQTSLLPFMALIGYLISSLFGVFLFYTAGYFVMMLAFVTSKEPEIITDNTKSPKKHKQ